MWSKKTCITNSLFRSSKWNILVQGTGAGFFCLEPTQFGRSRSRLRDLGLPEPPKKVAAPQHCLLGFNTIKRAMDWNFINYASTSKILTKNTLHYLVEHEFFSIQTAWYKKSTQSTPDHHLSSLVKLIRIQNVLTRCRPLRRSEFMTFLL